MVKTSPSLELKELLFFVTVQIVSLEPKKIHSLFFCQKQPGYYNSILTVPVGL